MHQVQLYDDADFDRLFTPERLADVDKAAAEVERGEFFTPEGADAELARRRTEWLRKNGR